MSTKFNIILIGCGGTGGNFMKELGRYLYQNPVNYRILLIDGDLVEEKNVARQPFLPEDIGRNKAEVMAEILQEAFGVSCEYYPDFLNQPEQLQKFEKQDYLTILVGCVDNHACRKVMHDYFIKADSCYYLDAANEYSAGEVVAGMRISGMELFPDRAFYFPEILTERSVPKSEESCLEINVSQPQHLVTNLFAANLLLKCIVEILSEEEWSGGIYFFDAFKGFSQLREERLVYE